MTSNGTTAVEFPATSAAEKRGVFASKDLLGAPLPNAHNRTIMASSDDMTWPTPQPIFDALNAEFQFTLDPCCVPATAKCAKYYTPKEDGLKQDWSGERAFVNPPYGRWLKPWMKKCYEESQRGALVVCLVPARVDTAWWHDYAAKGEVRFPRGRIKKRNGVAWPFPCAIVIFRARANGAPNNDSATPVR